MGVEVHEVEKTIAKRMTFCRACGENILKGEAWRRSHGTGSATGRTPPLRATSTHTIAPRYYPNGRSMTITEPTVSCDTNERLDDQKLQSLQSKEDEQSKRKERTDTLIAWALYTLFVLGGALEIFLVMRP